VLFGLLLAIGWFLGTGGSSSLFDGRGGMSASLEVRKDIPARGRFAGDRYIGSRACAECHPGEYALFTRSGHALTFRMATERRLTDQLAGVSAADPERPAVTWSYEKRGGRFRIRRQEAGKLEQYVADYALGSGHHATTFVTVLGLAPPRILEHRLTYYTQDQTLRITPGHVAGNEAPGTTPSGRDITSAETLKCLGCHATQLSELGNTDLDPSNLIPGVSCERCHGPGRDHVAAARRGAVAEELVLPMGLGRWTPQSQLEFCGKCHRHPLRVPPDRLNPDDPVLARFQPIGLSQSRCFQQSKGSITCVSCHDPHARSTSDPATYERVCLECHRQPGVPDDKGRQAVLPASRASTVCPVSPAAGCLSCHMPRVNSGQHVLFTDHWIRVHQASPGR
jgi:hypothetical protein